jgi:hypothetical protein
MGAPAQGPDGEKIGSVGQIFIDPVSNRPNWATIHTGMFGRHESFVPLDEATWDREVLHVPFAKDVVKDAPRVDTDEALSPDNEAELYRYYGITPDVELNDGAADADDADTRADENVGDRADENADEPAGGERMRRYTAPDDADSTAPVSHEEVEVGPGEQLLVQPGDSFAVEGDKPLLVTPAEQADAQADRDPFGFDDESVPDAAADDDSKPSGPKHRA